MVKALIFSLLLTLSLTASATNYLSFGGGNYVYAEQGNLYLNFDENVFDHRSWTYDGNGFSSEIKVDMTLKTKYTSSDWEEYIVANKKSDGLMYANYIKQPFNYQNKGRYQHSFAWVGWALRGGATASGYIGRTAAWQTFKNFAAKTVGSKASGYIALGSFFSLLGGDDIVCESMECTKTVTYAYELKEYGSHGIGTFTVRATPKQFETDNGLANVVFPHVARTHANFGGTLKECVSQANNPVVSCNYPKSNGQADWFDTNAFVGLAQPVTVQEIVSDPDLQWYFDRTCKLFASECVNEPTDGKNVQDVVLTGGSVSPIGVVGPPYTNPLTGISQQDKVVIGSASSGIGVHSGTNSSWQYTPSLGQSTTANPAEVTTIARPDLVGTGTVPVAKPNEQTGTKPQVVVPPVTVPEFTDLNDMIDFCKANPNALSCVEAKEEVKDTEIQIPETQQGLNFSPASIFANNGVCPAPVSVAFMTETLEFKYDQFCTILQYLRGIIIAVCAIIALRILMKEA